MENGESEGLEIGESEDIDAMYHKSKYIFSELVI